MDSVGEGEGGKIWENGIETCKISCMKRVASPGSMHDTGCLGLVHWKSFDIGYILRKFKCLRTAGQMINQNHMRENVG